MDLGGVDVWGQIALETSQMYVSEGGVIKSRFAGTVSANIISHQAHEEFNFFFIGKSNRPVKYSESNLSLDCQIY